MRAARGFAAVVAVAVLVMLAPGASAEHALIERVSVGPNGGNGPTHAFAENTSADGKAVVFSTAEALVVDDTDGCRDLYLRRGGVTALLTGGLPGGDCFPNEGGISSDGTRVVFSTSEQLTADDTDNQGDIYLWSNGVTTRVSLGPSGGNGPHLGRMYENVGFSEDGNVVVFGTFEQLVPEDTDAKFDLYKRSGGVTTLLTPGTNPTGDSYFPLLSKPDGARVFIVTDEPLLPEDTDSSSDVYELTGGTTTLLSAGLVGGNAEIDVLRVSISRDGSHVVFTTTESLVPEDLDSVRDIYDSQDGVLRLVSTGPAGGNAPTAANLLSGAHGVSDDGRVFFLTSESLVAADTDGEVDLYMHADGTTTLLSMGTSGGNGPQPVIGNAISRDGTHAYFSTFESLSPEDGDTRHDLYEWANGSVRPVSPPCLAADPCQSVTPMFAAVSDDGSRVFFTSGEMLVPSVPGGLPKLYERHGDTVTVVLDPEGNTLPFTYRLSRDGDRLTFNFSEPLLSGDTDDQQDIYTISLGTGYPRPKAAPWQRISLVPAYVACAAPNREHGPPLDFGSCAPPQQSSSHLTVGTADSNGQPTNSYNYLRFSAQVGDPSTAEDEADIRLNATFSDIRWASDLSDYTGALRVNASLRITDRFNDASPGGGTDPSTTIDMGFPIDVQCVATAATTIGASCDVDTSFDAIVPGAVKETQRSIWQRAQTQVFDGGADGDPATGPNELFMVQGIFIP